MQVSNTTPSLGMYFETTRPISAKAVHKPTPVAPASTASQASRPFDFSNITPNQMVSAMNDLISSGKMSVDESASLVGMIPTALSKVNFDGNAPDSFYQNKDFISELKIGVQGAKSRNDETNAANLQKALDALTRLQGTSPSFAPVNTTA